MEFLVGIVTFNPDISQLQTNLAFFCSEKKKVIVVDNGSGNIRDIRKICEQLNNVILLSCSTNEGIAKALNRAFAFAKQNNYSWVLTLDQDSEVDLNLLNQFRKCPESTTVGIYCPRIYDFVSGEYWPEVKSNSQEVVEIDKCITSGALTSVRAWSEINGFDNYLFIDEVDNDFCFRLRKRKYKIVLLCNALLKHKIGRTKVIKLLGRKIFIRNHSAMRKFYITRNRLYLDKKYYGHIKVQTAIMTVLFIIKTLVFEDQKLAKFFASNKGIIYAIKHK